VDDFLQFEDIVVNGHFDSKEFGIPFHETPEFANGIIRHDERR
jgi:hypothetical protein